MSGFATNRSYIPSIKLPINSFVILETFQNRQPIMFTSQLNQFRPKMPSFNSSIVFRDIQTQFCHNYELGSMGQETNHSLPTSKTLKTGCKHVAVEPFITQNAIYCQKFCPAVTFKFSSCHNVWLQYIRQHSNQQFLTCWSNLNFPSSIRILQTLLNFF